MSCSIETKTLNDTQFLEQKGKHWVIFTAAKPTPQIWPWWMRHHNASWCYYLGWPKNRCDYHC